MSTLPHASPLSLLQAIAEKCDDGIFFKDLSGNYLYCNPASFHFLGRDAAEVCSLHDNDIFPEDDARRLLEQDRRVLQTGLSDTAEYSCIGLRGIRRYRITKSMVVDQSGVPCGISGNIREVSISAQAEKTIRELNDFHEAVIRTAAEGICVCYEIPDFPYVQFTVWNHQMTELTGYTVTEINQGGWYQLLYPDPEQQSKAIRRMQEMRSQIDLKAEEWEIIRKDGQRRILSISTSTVKIADGLPGTVGMTPLPEQVRIHAQPTPHLRCRQTFRLNHTDCVTTEFLRILLINLTSSLLRHTLRSLWPLLYHTFQAPTFFGELQFPESTG